MSSFDITATRKCFPALDRKQVYLDNAGGSQTLGTVIDRYIDTPLPHSFILWSIYR